LTNAFFFELQILLSITVTQVVKGEQKSQQRWLHDEPKALKQSKPINTPFRLNLQTTSNKNQNQSKTKNSFQVHKVLQVATGYCILV